VFGPAESWLTRIPDRIVSSSTRFAEELAARHPRAPRVSLLADAVDTERFRPGLGSVPLRTELGIPADRRVIVFLGVLTRYQGVDHLLAAAREILARRDDAHFLVMGTRTSRPTARRRPPSASRAT